MIREELQRTGLLIGERALDVLAASRIAVFGIGGVGGSVCEALARSGVGAIDLIDKDVVSLSNINRQIIALHSTVGRPKTEVMAERIRDISPECKVTAINTFYLPENADNIDLSVYDYVVDAMDTVSAKIELIIRALAAGVPIVSSMGTGNKTDPTRLKISDVYKTDTCPLARVMRRELRSRGVKKLDVLFSDEPPLIRSERDSETGSSIPGSIAFVPTAAGLVIAGHVILKLIDNNGND